MEGILEMNGTDKYLLDTNVLDTLGLKIIKMHIQKVRIFEPESPQSSAIPASAYEPAPQLRRGTRMAQIKRIFTYMRLNRARG